MPQLTIELDGELMAHLGIEARRRGISSQVLLEELLRTELKVPKPAPVTIAPPEIVPDPLPFFSTEKLIALLGIHEPEVRQGAREQLMAMGQSAISQLEAALETAEGSRLLAIVELLVLSGSPSVTLPLLIAYAKGSSSQKPSLYHELRALLGRYTLLPDSAWKAIQACTVRTAPLVAWQVKTSLGLPIGSKDTINPLDFREASSAAEIASLTALLRWQRTGDVARQVAAALNQIALTNPVPQLREALPLLHPAWHIRLTHPELVEALKTIEAATALWKDLPLPAEGDRELGSYNLPVPVE